MTALCAEEKGAGLCLPEETDRNNRLNKLSLLQMKSLLGS